MGYAVIMLLCCAVSAFAIITRLAPSTSRARRSAWPFPSQPRWARGIRDAARRRLSNDRPTPPPERSVMFIVMGSCRSVTMPCGRHDPKAAPVVAKPLGPFLRTMRGISLRRDLQVAAVFLFSANRSAMKKAPDFLRRTNFMESPWGAGGIQQRFTRYAQPWGLARPQPA
jgi:hypothetical protein